MSEQPEQILAVFVLDDDVAARRFLKAVEGRHPCPTASRPEPTGAQGPFLAPCLRSVRL